jgi:hypothetical protein
MIIPLRWAGVKSGLKDTLTPGLGIQGNTTEPKAGDLTEVLIKAANIIIETACRVCLNIRKVCHIINKKQGLGTGF